MSSWKRVLLTLVFFFVYASWWEKINVILVVSGSQTTTTLHSSTPSESHPSVSRSVIEPRRSHPQNLRTRNRYTSRSNPIQSSHDETTTIQKQRKLSPPPPPAAAATVTTRERNENRRRDLSALQPRIIGGNNAPIGRYPSMVFLSDRTDTLSCGGTLVSPTVVLTAAHCEVYVCVIASISVSIEFVG